MWVKLPSTAIECIFGWLGTRDVEVSQQTCKTWRNCIGKTGVWKTCLAQFMRVC